MERLVITEEVAQEMMEKDANMGVLTATGMRLLTRLLRVHNDGFTVELEVVARIAD